MLAESLGPALAACPAVDPVAVVGVFHKMTAPPTFLTHVDLDLGGGEKLAVASDVAWSELIVRLADQHETQVDLVLE